MQRSFMKPWFNQTALRPLSFLSSSLPLNNTVMRPLFETQCRTYAVKKKTLFKRLLYKKGIFLPRVPITSGTNYGIFAGDNFNARKGLLECIRVTAKRELKKKDLVRVKPPANLPFTAKAAGVRMGKGKGPIKEYQAQLRIGTPIVEFTADKLKTAQNLLNKLKYKMPGRIYGYCKDTGKKFYFQNRRELRIKYR